ncbi:ornithine--oxo-acid transaminase [Staphylococcus schweitzeri]|uniref:Ornithine aminotransferase n=1 Tax=Staphylococcus schweitzeri TaxID=1654388 RepID=A0A2K4AMJ6_9STAP|nr:ornithine--oxo-acid transaminase [Staphylococcus schweitzeri]MBE2127723.1 ornithine--oxo-acid transaminase [Staphylococcus schweitzeri]PNZ51315.1 ornithine--oxo-acid transaminase [Staphylococcus schweitzeri]CDR53274.1 Ornithine aminotransferase 1 [Staphylococcus schweitzeri]CDR61713.1 Ornithine aminotransferase 1 [Staphylococcus schweitzeri]VEE64767.1 Ornithine aminotransferase 2 [Staphylococcus schweitzeri]
MNSIIKLTDQYSSNNYAPLKIVITRGKGTKVWDTNGKQYIDCISGFSVANQGHCHPQIVKAMTEQASKLSIISRVLYSDNLGKWEEKICNLAKKDKVLPLNSGTEAVEAAIKIARKWGSDVKKIPDGQVEIIAMNNNFHGRTLGSLSLSNHDSYKVGFHPLLQGITTVDFGNIEQLEQAITSNTAAIILEPIQGEGGVNIPPRGYIQAVRQLCDKQQILLIADEIQVGLGRTGKWFAMEWEQVIPDIYILGKALGGGIYPVSAVLANNDVMRVLTPGTHGSTFGGNPLAIAVSTAALDVLKNEALIERSERLGLLLLAQLQQLDNPNIKEIRGRGLFIGIELNTDAAPFVQKLINRGILCKETHRTIIRLSPPLVINEDEINHIISVFQDVFLN